MIVSLMTTTPEFANDLADGIRIFWGNSDCRINDAGGEVTVSHAEETAEGRRVCRVSLSGRYSAQTEKSAPVSDDPLLEKRYHKRLIKQTLYDAMKQVTGRRPPWGSLTGVFTAGSGGRNPQPV